MAELVSRLATEYQCEVHLYASKVADLEVSRVFESPPASGGSVIWHRVPSIPGPHLFQFIFWFYANRLCRVWDRTIHGLHFDAVFSPGINCSDADVILVHAVFHRLAELASFSQAGGLRGLHQRLYYGAICRLEQQIYASPRVALAAVSGHTASQISRYFGRSDVVIVPNGVDSRHFPPEQLVPLRDPARQHWGFQPSERILLLIGNDWRTKGLPVLLETLSLCLDVPVRALVVGEEDPAPFLARAQSLGVRDRVTFATPEQDVRQFYAASDVLVAPSLEDSFNLPALEAMSCGLPVIVSLNAGISEWVHPGEDGLILRDPRDARELANTLHELVGHPDRMRFLGGNAARTAATLSWERHAAALLALLDSRSQRRTGK